MKRKLVCIVCPRGCEMIAEISGDSVTVAGNACPNGARYAQTECLHPVRTVTATVRVANRKDTMVSVKTESPVAKDSMQEVMKCLRKTSVNAPLAIGDVVLESVCGSKIIVTKAVQ